MSDTKNRSWVLSRPETIDEILQALHGVAERIDRLNPIINAICYPTMELAQRDAERLRDIGDLAKSGPLSGMVVGVKDNIDVAGYPTSVGSPLFSDSVVEDDAAVVTRLREAGALIVGKTLPHEFAYGVTTKNRHFGICRNPWNLDHIPGGSSGGSGAAVAADMCVAALGTDTGGSVRIPAALNGASGLRPTVGSVSNRGVFPLSPSFDTVGPIARSFRDVWAVFSVLRGYDRSDPWAIEPPSARRELGRTDSLEGMRIGIQEDEYWLDADVDTAHAVEAGVEQLQELGAAIVPVRISGAQTARDDCNTILRAEALELHEKRLASQPEMIDPEIRDRLLLPGPITGTEFARALRTMLEWRVRVLDCFEQVDAVVMPTTPSPAPAIELSNTIDMARALTRFTYPWSAARVPAASVPCGFSAGGLPIGMQVVARPWRETVLARISIAYQSVTDFHLQRPPLEV